LSNKSLILNDSVSNFMLKLDKLMATDLDSGLNGQIKFKIERQVKFIKDNKSNVNRIEESFVAQKMIFKIDAQTGDLITNIAMKTKATVLSSSSAENTSKLIGSFKLNKNNQISLDSIDENQLGVYGLVVSMTDQSATDPLTTRAYIFLKLSSSYESKSFEAEMTLLRSVLKEIPNLNNENIENEDEDDYYDDDYATDIKQDAKFQRIIEQFKNYNINKNQNMMNKDLKLLKKVEQNQNLASWTNLRRIFDEFFSSLNKNHIHQKWFLIATVITSVLFAVILISLCMLVTSCNRKKRTGASVRVSKETKDNQQNYAHFLNIENRSKSSSTSSTNSTLLTKSNNQTSSELFVDDLHSGRVTKVRISTTTEDDEDELDYGRKIRKISTVNNNKKQTTFGNTMMLQQKRADLNSSTSSSSNDEEKLALMGSSSLPPKSNQSSSANNLQSPSQSSSSSSNAVLSNHTDSTSATLSSRHKQLSVIVNNNETTAKIVQEKLNKKDLNRMCIVASVESLSTISSTSINKMAPNLTSSPHDSSSKNFQTFKNSPKPQLRNNQNKSSYGTLPYRNNIVNNSNQIAKPVGSTRKVTLDQKPLNLPVNELFKRYEMKKQAANGLLSTSTSSLNNSDNNNFSTFNNSNNNNNATTPKLKHINLLQNDMNNVPDYFFKDEKEHRKFMNSNIQKI
jgi:hypothetical protein